MPKVGKKTFAYTPKGKAAAKKMAKKVVKHFSETLQEYDQPKS